MIKDKNTMYLAKLTWLRGVAATLVVCSHALRISEGDYGQAKEPTNSLHWFNFFDFWCPDSKDTVTKGQIR